MVSVAMVQINLSITGTIPCKQIFPKNKIYFVLKIYLLTQQEAKQLSLYNGFSTFSFQLL